MSFFELLFWSIIGIIIIYFLGKYFDNKMKTMKSDCLKHIKPPKDITENDW